MGNRKSDGKTPDSYGVICMRDGKVLLIRHRFGWSFPKGRQEPGESGEQTALRETREETGLEVSLVPGFSVRVPSAKPGEKRWVTYFLSLCVFGQLCFQEEELCDAAWFPLSEVRNLLGFACDAAAFDKACAFLR